MDQRNKEILYFIKEIMNVKVKDSIKKLVPDKSPQRVFVSSLYDLAVNEYGKDNLEKNSETINFTIFKTLADLSTSSTEIT
jgi:hypothetical protein